jgi:hypothetical protein
MEIESFINSNRSLFSKETPEGLLVLSCDEKELYLLKGTAPLVWDKADGTIRIKDIIEDISQKFSIDASKTEKDVLLFLKDVLKQAPSLFTLSDIPIKA